ncbi:zinc ribbon domain-containing protein [Herbidospora mongoliensis]|uniref:zinc ribbon domain-containing protein n=1 Tax=Herbidospora mongoliensis TaxID=688067 RepID=UPI0034E2E81A
MGGEDLYEPRPTLRRHRRRRPEGRQDDQIRARINRDSRENIRQKSGLNRRILASGWGLLVTRLEHKATGRVVKINPRFTSQTCNSCKSIARRSRKSQALLQCVTCGHRVNADVNAARNIRDIAAGHAANARGGDRAAGPVNREPRLLSASA